MTCGFMEGYVPDHFLLGAASLDKQDVLIRELHGSLWEDFSSSCLRTLNLH